MRRIVTGLVATGIDVTITAFAAGAASAATLAPQASATVTAYTDSTLGFAIEADYLSPSANAVTCQAVDYEAGTDNWGFTGTGDPTLEVGMYIQGDEPAHAVRVLGVAGRNADLRFGSRGREGEMPCTPAPSRGPD